MASKIDSIISEVLKAEGGGKITNDPADSGGRTQWGISETANPGAWKDGKVTEQEAREIYLQKYVIWPGFHKLPASHSALQAQLIDYGVNSGPAIAIQKLQGLLGVDVDGVLGPQTLQAIKNHDSRIVNNNLVQARCRMICRIVQKQPSQLKFLAGWIDRALSFLV